jgi:GTP pyrophosphokinase
MFNDIDALEKIKSAYEFVRSIYAKNAESEEELKVLRAFDIAIIVIKKMGLGTESVISCLLFDAVYENILSFEKLKENFGEEVAHIISGLIKLTEVDTKNISLQIKDTGGAKKWIDIEKREKEQSENFIKLLLTLSSDIRSILIRLAHRLHLMRNIDKYEDEIKELMSMEALKSYAPIAHRLGLNSIKTELEEISLKSSNYKIYSFIENKLKETKVERENFIKKFTISIKKELRIRGFDFEIKGRPKSIYSIMKKMKRQRVNFEGIYDLFAIRIILTKDYYKTIKSTKNISESISKIKQIEKTDCWQVYSIVTNLYQPSAKRLRDWLSNPRPSGYESLHTTVIGQDGKWVEVQIRTSRMDEVAEKGHAAHWKYKGGKSSQLDAWLSKVREILEGTDKDLSYAFDNTKIKKFVNEIYVFTPNNELKKMRYGSSVLDFAYLIHSEVGTHCLGAKVNGRFVSFKHVLRNGDTIEVITSKNQKPSRGWLEYVISPRAKAKIKKAVNEAEYKNAKIGKELLQKKFGQWEIDYTDKTLTLVMNEFGFRTPYQLFQEVGCGSLELLKIKKYFSARKKFKLLEQQKSSEQVAELQEEKIYDNYLIIDKLDNIDYKRAKCCNPIPGDKIFGFITANNGTKIHKDSCPNSIDMKTRFAYRIVNAKWNEIVDKTILTVNFRISGDNKPDIEKNISQIFAENYKVSQHSISLKSDNEKFKAKVEARLLDKSHVEVLLHKIKTVKGVKTVSTY